MKMTNTNQTIGIQTASVHYNEQVFISTNLWSRFINWCKGQQHNRLLWLGIALAAHGCVLTPITVLIVMLAGANFSLVVLALAAMGMSLVTNLAAMPTKITIPVFILSILIDIAILIATVFIGYNLSAAFA